MSYMFYGAHAFGSDVSAWVRHLKFGPQYIPPLQHGFYLMVSLCFPTKKNTHTLANGVW